MALVNGGGFQYIQGQYELRRSVMSSTASFRPGDVVTLSNDRTVIRAESDTTGIYGVAQHDSADSLPGNQSGKALILIPYPDTVFAAKVQTGVAGSAISAGQSYNIESASARHRVDTDSQTTPMVTIVPDGDGNLIDSASSEVYVQFIKDKIGVFGSNASVNIFAQD